MDVEQRHGLGQDLPARQMDVHGRRAVSILCVLLGEVGFWIMMISMMAAAFVPIIYSYILWSGEESGLVVSRETQGSEHGINH